MSQPADPVPTQPAVPPSEVVTVRQTTTERDVRQSADLSRWQSFIGGFATDGGRAFLALVYETSHIVVSLAVLVGGLVMVAKGIDYGKEVASVAGGWLGRSMVGPQQKEKQ